MNCRPLIQENAANNLQEAARTLTQLVTAPMRVKLTKLKTALQLVEGGRDKSAFEKRALKEKLKGIFISEREPIKEQISHYIALEEKICGTFSQALQAQLFQKLSNVQINDRTQVWTIETSNYGAIQSQILNAAADLTDCPYPFSGTGDLQPSISIIFHGRTPVEYTVMDEDPSVSDERLNNFLRLTGHDLQQVQITQEGPYISIHSKEEAVGFVQRALAYLPAVFFAAPRAAAIAPAAAPVEIAEAEKVDDGRYHIEIPEGCSKPLQEQLEWMNGLVAKRNRFHEDAINDMEENGKYDNLCSELNLEIPDCPVYLGLVHLYDLKELLDLLKKGGGVATRPYDINKTFTIEDISPAMPIQIQIGDLIAAFNLAHDVESEAEDLDVVSHVKRRKRI